MPTKYRPSTWASPDIESLRDFDALYPAAVLDPILEAGPKLITAPAKARLRQQIVDVALELFATQKMSSRPSVNKKRAALEKLQKDATKISRPLRVLDDDSAQVLYDAAGADVEEKDLENAGLEPPDDLSVARRKIGHDRIAKIQDDVDRQIAQLNTWAQQAENSLGPAPLGRPPNDALRNAALGMREAWKKAAGTEPTHAPFINFVGLALSPIVGNVDFDGTCREVLYGEKPGKRHLR